MHPEAIKGTEHNTQGSSHRVAPRGAYTIANTTSLAQWKFYSLL